MEEKKKSFTKWNKRRLVILEAINQVIAKQEENWNGRDQRADAVHLKDQDFGKYSKSNGNLWMALK